VGWEHNELIGRYDPLWLSKPELSLLEHCMKLVLEAIQFPAAHIEVTPFNNEGSFNTLYLVSSSMKEISEKTPLEMQRLLRIAKSVYPWYKTES
jgi:hypothetical protein